MKTSTDQTEGDNRLIMTAVICRDQSHNSRNKDASSMRNPIATALRANEYKNFSDRQFDRVSSLETSTCAQPKQLEGKHRIFEQKNLFAFYSFFLFLLHHLFSKQSLLLTSTFPFCPKRAVLPKTQTTAFKHEETRNCMPRNYVNIGSSRLYKLLLFTTSLLLFASQVTANTIHFRESYKLGNTPAAIRLYKDPQYQQEYSQASTLSSDQIIYVEVNMNVGQLSEAKMQIEKYWATLTPSPNDKESVTLIENGCHVSTLVHVTIAENGVSDRVRFSHKVFKFPASPTLTLHCNLRLCLESCTQICGRRRRRMISEEANYRHVQTSLSTNVAETNSTNS